MGQHTWFYKDSKLRDEELKLWKKLDSYDECSIWKDDLEIMQINHEIGTISNSNRAEYHDLFRTYKRNEDKTYTDDVITSKKDCDIWLEENKDLVTWLDEESSRKLLNEFWDKYPTGAIDFG